MPVLVHEDSIDVPNGTRTLFHTSSPYVIGTVKVWINGQLKRWDLDDGFAELGYSRVQLKVAPNSDDHVTFQYRPL